MAELVKSLSEMLLIQKRTTVAYHPQCNGLTERFNRTLSTMLSMYVNESHSDWDVFLPYVVFAYNTKFQESLQHTPFFLVYGRTATLPIDALLLPSRNRTVQQRLSQIATHLVGARQLARKNLVETQQRSALRYNEGRQVAKFKPGQKVWVWIPAKKKGKTKKLLHFYKGPFVIEKQLGPVDFSLKHCVSGELRSVHVSQMKVVYDPDSDASTEVENEQDSESGSESDNSVCVSFRRAPSPSSSSSSSESSTATVVHTGRSPDQLDGSPGSPPWLQLSPDVVEEPQPVESSSTESSASSSSDARTSSRVRTKNPRYFGNEWDS